MKKYYINEELKAKPLKVSFSSELSKKIISIIQYNRHNDYAIREWCKYLKLKKEYVSKRQIAFDYSVSHNYDDYETKGLLNITKIHKMSYEIKEDKNGEIYVCIVSTKLKPLDYGLEIPPSFTESKETNNQYMSLRDYITELKYINNNSKG